MASAAPEEKADIGRVLGGGFGAIGANFLPFLAIALIVVGAPTFAMQYWGASTLDLAAPGAAGAPPDWGWMVGDLLLFFVTSALLYGVLVRATVLHLSGRDPSPWTSALLALRLLPALIGLSLVVGLMIGIGMVFLIVPGVMVYCATAVATPALIEERGGIFGSIQRSFDLTRGSRWHVFGILVLYGILAAVIQSIAGLFTGVTMFGVTEPAIADRAIASLAEAASASVSNMILAVVLAVLYVELREVKEGTSVDELANVFN